MRRPRKIVEVTWIDAQTVDHGGWDNLDELQKHKNEGAPATSIGFQIDRTSKGITLAASLTFDREGEIDLVSGSMIIPAGMIRKVRVLK